eukprot:COSAG02_NODE_29124_length_575_cov_2.525223_1_plen_45_part_10
MHCDQPFDRLKVTIVVIVIAIQIVITAHLPYSLHISLAHTCDVKL